jgi:OHCU decarboxylase
MTLQEFNGLKKDTAKAELLKCCGSRKWASLMMESFPFDSNEDLHNKAATIWYDECKEEDWLEASQHHPKIGGLSTLLPRGGFVVGPASTQDWAAAEQSGVKQANAEITEILARRNKEYEEKFGFIFIVCATGKSAEEMLAILENRLINNYDEEINIAMSEQNKITQIRLKKMIND